MKRNKVIQSSEGMKKELHLLGEPLPSFAYKGWSKSRIWCIVCLCDVISQMKNQGCKYLSEHI